MRTWAIGDLQGCLDEFKQLLDVIDFDPGRDRLWLTGDLVNRGPASLETLRFVRDLGDSAVTVLGNHDLALLVFAAGHRDMKQKDTLQGILDAPDRDELLPWLQHRPLAHYDSGLDCLLIHAGLPPQWDRDTTLACAAEVEAVLQGNDADELLANMFGNDPDRWRDDLEGLPRWRFIINALTRMRFCRADGTLDLSNKGAPGSQPDELLPWYAVPGRASVGQRLVFGHWSTLGQLAADDPPPEVHALDTGCLWGGKLTALRLDIDPGNADARQCVDCENRTDRSRQ